MGLRRPVWDKMTFGQARERIRTCKTEGLMVRADTPTHCAELSGQRTTHHGQ
jgi:hypothetical protein